MQNQLKILFTLKKPTLTPFFFVPTSGQRGAVLSVGQVTDFHERTCGRLPVEQTESNHSHSRQPGPAAG